jgi:hypothetical protein
VYFLYKNSLTALSESPPQIYAVVPSVLETQGGENVTMALSIDVTMVDLRQPYTVEVYVGTFPCVEPRMVPYGEGGVVGVGVAAKEAAAAVVGVGVGARGGIVPLPGATAAANQNQDQMHQGVGGGGGEGAATFLPFPSVPASENQVPYLLTCVSTPGVGAHLLAQATISQGGSEIPLVMAKAVSYQVGTIYVYVCTHTYTYIHTHIYIHIQIPSSSLTNPPTHSLTHVHHTHPHTPLQNHSHPSSPPSSPPPPPPAAASTST